MNPSAYLNSPSAVHQAALLSLSDSMLPPTAFLRVAANQSVKSATRIQSLANSTSTVTALLAGLITRYLRRLKLVIIFGGVVQTIAMGASSVPVSSRLDPAAHPSRCRTHDPLPRREQLSS